MGIRRKRMIPCAVALVVLATAGQGDAEDPACRADTVHLKGDWGIARFAVEIADDPAERAQGLMHRTSMPSSSGMLFLYGKPQALTFWMRNTLIPLDMLFIDPQGLVQHIHHEAIPLDETAIPGGEGLIAVLEINGGLARRMGIEEGSQVRHPGLPVQSVLWPC